MNLVSFAWMLLQRPRGQALLLEVIVGFLIVLAVVLIVASLFPSSYRASLQAGRMTAASYLARQVLERQKQQLPVDALPIPDQTFDASFEAQGRMVQCQMVYRVDRVSAVGALPPVWRVTVRWEDQGRTRDLFLVGAGRPP